MQSGKEMKDKSKQSGFFFFWEHTAPSSVSVLTFQSIKCFFLLVYLFIYLLGGGILTLAAAPSLSSKVALSGRPLVSLSVYRPFRLPTCEHGKTISHSAYTIPNF